MKKHKVTYLRIPSVLLEKLGHQLSSHAWIVPYRRLWTAERDINCGRIKDVLMWFR